MIPAPFSVPRPPTKTPRPTIRKRIVARDEPETASPRPRPASGPRTSQAPAKMSAVHPFFTTKTKTETPLDATARVLFEAMKSYLPEKPPADPATARRMMDEALEKAVGKPEPKPKPKPKPRFRYENAPDLSERRAEWVKRSEAFWERIRTWVSQGSKKNAERDALDVEFKSLEKEARTLWTASDVRKSPSERPT